MDFKHFCERKAMLGYGSALLYKDSSDTSITKYHLLMPLEGTPVVSGSNDTYEIDILTCPSKTLLQGKRAFDAVDGDFLWHRDNTDLLDSLKGKVLDFLVVYQDFTGWAFSGTIDFRPNESEPEVQRGTYTLTPMSDTGYISDCRDLVIDTAWFISEIPNVVEIPTTGYELNLPVNPDDATVTVDTTKSTNVKLSTDNSDTTSAFDATITAASASSPAKLTVARVNSKTSPQYGVIVLTVSKSGMAPHSTTIAVEF